MSKATLTREKGSSHSDGNHYAMIQMGWPEILKLAPQCRFNNCLHVREPGCAVLEAVAEQMLSATNAL